MRIYLLTTLCALMASFMVAQVALGAPSRSDTNDNTLTASPSTSPDIPPSIPQNKNTPSSSDQTELNTKPVSPPKPNGLFNSGISPRTYIGDSFLGLVKATDRWLGGDHIQESNRSFLKAEYQVTAFETRPNESDLRLRAKAHLPGTKKRLKLFIDSDLEQDQALDQRGLDIARGRDINQNDTSAGLEVGNNKDAFKRAVQVGIKTGSSLRPFVRFRLENKWQLSHYWQLHARQDFWHFDEIGFGETTFLNFLRPINANIGLSIMTEIEYRDNPNPLQYLHEWVLGQALSEKTHLQYKTGALGIVRDNEYFQERFAAITYRRQLNKEWAFINITPQVLFTRENDWQAEGVLTVNLEVFFTD